MNYNNLLYNFFQVMIQFCSSPFRKSFFLIAIVNVIDIVIFFLIFLR